MLYLFAFAVGKHSAAKMVHFSFLVATVVAMLAFSRRHGLWRAGVAGAVLYACSPVVGADAASTYNDCALAFYEFSAFYALLLWWRGRQRGWLVIIGILAGILLFHQIHGRTDAAGRRRAGGLGELAAPPKCPGRSDPLACRGGRGVAVCFALDREERNTGRESSGSIFQPVLSQPLRHGSLLRIRTGIT